MHVILTSLGTDGDILPFVGLGTALKARGHRVTLVAGDDYAPLASAHAIEFESLVSRSESEELFGHPDFWHPLKTPRLSARWGARFLPRQFDLFARLVQGPKTLIVSNPGVLAAAVLAESRQLPWVTLVLQPWIIPSSLRPPYFQGLAWFRRAPQPLWKLLWRGIDVVGAVLVGRELNAVRAAAGLKPIHRIFQNWLSPHLALGLFPEWFGNPAADWPPQLRLVGFPLFDGNRSRPLPTEVARFCGDGAAPVAFTFGTGMRHSADLFQLALETCQASGRRAVFLTRYRNQLPATLPANILHTEFAPFQKLFPHCAAVVHHGGIGTTAQALAAGTPQLHLPICFDQPDNSERVKALGAGDWIASRRARPSMLMTALSKLTTDASRSRCAAIAQRLDSANTFELAADHIEKLAERGDAGEP